jgi:hypothetical protein
MTFELDHLFICTDRGAAVADRLVTLGLIEGSPNIHPGQGTANRRFFFDNLMLEFLWVHNPGEAQSEPIARTRLWERWVGRNSSACPFGLCLRPGMGEEAIAPFSHWAYHPPYLPASLSIAVGTNSDVLTEPMLFVIAFGKRPDQLPIEKAQPLNHPIGFRNITRVSLSGPIASPPTSEWQAMLEAVSLPYQSSPDYCLELGFDGEFQGQRLDFCPELPLIFSW